MFINCYAVSYLHIVQLTIKTMLSLSEMHHDILINQKKYYFLCRELIKRSGRQLNYARLLFVKFMHTFLAQHISISFVLVMILNRVPSLFCFHVIIIFIINVDILMYPICLYTLMYLQLIYYLLHIKCQLTGFLQHFISN